MGKGSGVRRRGRRLVALAAVLALAGAACGDDGGDGTASGGAGGSGASTTVDGVEVPQEPGPPCTLVTESDVETAVGADVKQVSARSQGPSRGCVFSLTSAQEERVVVLVANSANSAAAFEQAKAGARIENVTGVGDRAFLADNKAVALRGSTLVIIVVGLKQPTPSLGQMARKLAQSAVNRV